MPVTERTPTDASFASFLTRLAAPAAKARDMWSDAELGDDVVTLSYEQALHTHGRTRLSNPHSPSSPPDFDLPDSRQTVPAAAPAPAKAAAGPAPHLASLEESRKSSSVTIRLSQIECEQLRERAAAAGLTVSAYLRSCIFEVETLRSQVKNMLTQLRSGAVVENEPQQAKTEPPRAAALARRWLVLPQLRWLFFPRGTASQRVVHA
jgi:hypothetical protein